MLCIALFALLLVVGFSVYLLRDTALPDRMIAPVAAPVAVPAPAFVPVRVLAEEERKPPIEPIESVTLGAKSELQYVMNRHFRATQYAEIESIRVSGIYMSGSVEIKIISLAKKPHFYRQTVVYDDAQIDSGFDGERYWHSQSRPIFDESNESGKLILALNRILFILESSIPYLTWEYEKGLQAREKFQLMEGEIWNGRRCSVIKNSGLYESPIYHYIDAVTGLELGRRVSFRVGTPNHKEIELRYLPPLPDSEHALPSGAEVYIDGELYGVTKLNKIEVNQGLLNFLFRAQ